MYKIIYIGYVYMCVCVGVFIFTSVMNVLQDLRIYYNAPSIEIKLVQIKTLCKDLRMNYMK